MPDALIGHTGFVGSNLAKQMHFDEFYNSKNIEDIRGRSFDLLVCAGAPGAKWYANAHPEEDFGEVRRLLSFICDLDVRLVIIISTIDAAQPGDPYGCHRAYLEDSLRSPLIPSVVIRLPALFAPGLKKNALYDLMTATRTQMIAPNATYQWYPLRRLGHDIDRVLDSGKRLVTMGSEPITMADIRARFFSDRRIGLYSDNAANYNVAGDPEFMLTRDEVLAEMGAFLADA